MMGPCRMFNAWGAYRVSAINRQSQIILIPMKIGTQPLSLCRYVVGITAPEFQSSLIAFDQLGTDFRQHEERFDMPRRRPIRAPQYLQAASCNLALGRWVGHIGFFFFLLRLFHFFFGFLLTFGHVIFLYAGPTGPDGAMLD